VAKTTATKNTAKTKKTATETTTSKGAKKTARPVAPSPGCL
jgi:hypothetical protein